LRPLIPVILAITGLSLACTPSREFLLKRAAEVGIDKHYVKVLVLATGERVTVSSATRIKIRDLKLKRILYDGAGKKLHFYPEKVTSPLLVESWESPLSVNGKAYRSAIEVHNVLGRLLAVNVVKMDEYLYGVVASEISGGWDPAALKAQAVAARTYAYYHIMNNKESFYDLDATNSFQVYGGVSVENEAVRRAVDTTAGEIAVFDNKPILAYFHSTCGGRTINSRYVWGNSDLKYLRGVRCEYCKRSPHYAWEEKISLYDIRLHLSRKYHGVGPVNGISLRKADGRVISVVVTHRNGTVKMTGNEFRLLFPEKKIRSLSFEAYKENDGLVLHGHGWGHGVGLCQWGAYGMALKGKSYRDILKYYYRGIRFIDVGTHELSGDEARKKAPPASGRGSSG
jgi:stage II sporulation protein D